MAESDKSHVTWFKLKSKLELEMIKKGLDLTLIFKISF